MSDIWVYCKYYLVWSAHSLWDMVFTFGQQDLGCCILFMVLSCGGSMNEINPWPLKGSKENSFRINNYYEKNYNNGL